MDKDNFLAKVKDSKAHLTIERLGVNPPAEGDSSNKFYVNEVIPPSKRIIFNVAMQLQKAGLV